MQSGFTPWTDKGLLLLSVARRSVRNALLSHRNLRPKSLIRVERWWVSFVVICWPAIQRRRRTRPFLPFPTALNAIEEASMRKICENITERKWTPKTGPRDKREWCWPKRSGSVRFGFRFQGGDHGQGTAAAQCGFQGEGGVGGDAGAGNGGRGGTGCRPLSRRTLASELTATTNPEQKDRRPQAAGDLWGWRSARKRDQASAPKWTTLD